MSSIAVPPLIQPLIKKWQQNCWEISLAAILALAFVFFLLVLPSYGASFDEPSLYPYADRTLEAYKNLVIGQPLPAFELTYALSYYGPAYLTIGRVGVGLIQAIAPRLDIYDSWHIINFINFLLGAWLIFLLTQRVSSKPAAWMAALLFLTQPLLWGHGVMNPKDLPFLTSFMATLVCGFKMVDMFAQPVSDGERLGNSKQLKTSTRRIMWLLLTGIFSGLTISIRVLGPAAAGLVCFYAFMLNRPERWKILLGVGSISMIVMYITWPFLWGNPVYIFFKALKTMLAFPWIGTLRFEGLNYQASELPWYYLPKLIGIQFTLPLIFLALAGTVLLIRRIISKSQGWSTAIMLLIWFWVPMVVVMVLQPNSYDNFRQYLFITPPLFAMAGVTLDKLMLIINQPVLRYLVAGIVFVPGIIAGVWLHPYEYVYYNALVGWTGNIQRNYETDYWATAMCEAGAFVSEQSPLPKVAIFNDSVQAQFFTRCSNKAIDIQLDPYGELNIPGDIVVVWSRFDDDVTHYPNRSLIYEIKRGKTIFAVIKGNIETKSP